MDKQECLGCLFKIGSLYKIPAPELTTYADVLLAACGWMTAAEFRRAADMVLKSAGHSRPKPADYIAAHRAAGGSKPKPRSECGECDGTGLITGFRKNRDDGRVIVTAARCPACVKSWRPNPDLADWDPISEREYWDALGGTALEAYKFGQGLGQQFRAGNISFNDAMAVGFAQGRSMAGNATSPQKTLADHYQDARMTLKLDTPSQPSSDKDALISE